MPKTSSATGTSPIEPMPTGTAAPPASVDSCTEGEVIGTFVLVFVILCFGTPGAPTGALGALSVALLVLVIGLSLGGTTGYAINPARDLGPRIAHYLLPIPGKRDSDWGYAWVPVLGPLLGGPLAALVYSLVS